MAEGIGSLYLRLGLNLSELETGFVEASRTVAANINRLNRESDLIRLRSQVEIAGLDETADAERIVQIRTNALNQQLAIQRDRVRILNAEYRNLVQSQGENSVAAQRAVIRLERERLAMANLEREMRNLNGTTEESTNSFDDLNSLLPEIPTRLQAIGMAAGALATGIGFATDATKEMIADFRELEKQAYELNMSVNDTEQFLRELALAGGDIGDFEGYIRGITDAFVKGEYDDPEFIALRKYGAEITDATGRLKEFAEIADEVYKAWEKADEAGEGIEFLQLTGGESGIRDTIQLFQRLKEAREDAAKVYDGNLDGDQLHELERALNLTAAQSNELKNAIGNIFTPAVQSAAEKFFELLHGGTQYLVENKEEFQRWGFIASEVLSELVPKIENLFPSGQFKMAMDSFSALKKEIESFSDSTAKIDFGDEKANAAFAKLNSDAEKFYSASPLQKIWDSLFDSDAVKNNFIVSAIKRGEAAAAEFNGELEESNALTRALGESLSKGADLVKKIASGDPLSQYGWQRLQQFKDELEDLRIEIDFGDNDYEKAKAQLDLWRQRELEDKLQVSLKERQAIEELYAAKSEQIEQDRADKLAEIRQQVSAADQTELERRMSTIESEKEKWIQVGMETAEAEQIAQKQKTAYISGINNQLSAELNSLGQTDLQRRLSQIEQEKQAWIQKGADVEQAERLAQEKIRQAHEETEKKLNEIRQSVAELDNTELENRLAAIEREKNAWIQAGMEKAEAEELAQQKILHVQEDYEAKRAEAQKQYNEQVAKAQEDYIKRVQAAQEEAERKNKAIFNEALNIVKQEAREFEAFLKDGYKGLQDLMYKDLLESGVKPETLEAMTPEKLKNYKAAKDAATQSFLPNWKDPYSPERVEPPKIEMPDILAEVPPSFDKVSVSADNAAQSLDNLARAAGYTPMEGIDGINDLRAYKRPDGSTFITNKPQDLEDDTKNVTSALSDLATNIKDSVKGIPNVEPTQIPEVEPIEIPEIDSSVITESVQSLSEMPEAVQAANETLNELPKVVQGVMEQISAIEPQQLQENNFAEIEQSLSQLPTVIQTATDSLRDLPIAVSSVNEKFSSMDILFSDFGQSVQEVTIRINDLGTALENFFSARTNAPTQTEQRPPVEVTTNVQIDEAHAWDYDHIQELADQVAAIVQPAIINAIGGDSNSY